MCKKTFLHSPRLLNRSCWSTVNTGVPFPRKDNTGFFLWVTVSVFRCWLTFLLSWATAAAFPWVTLFLLVVSGECWWHHWNVTKIKKSSHHSRDCGISAIFPAWWVQQLTYSTCKSSWMQLIFKYLYIPAHTEWNGEKISNNPQISPCRYFPGSEGPCDEAYSHGSGQSGPPDRVERLV